MSVIWTEPMIEALKALRAQRVPLYTCAWKIGVAYPTAVYKARELGIANRMNRGRVAGEQIAEAERKAASRGAMRPTAAHSARAQA